MRLAAAALAVACSAPVAAPSPTPLASASLPPRPTAAVVTPAPTAAATPRPAEPVWAQAVRVPPAHRYVVVEAFDQVRAWLVDETGAAPATAVVEWSPRGSPAADQFAATPDGRTILFSSVIPGERAAIHLVHPETGDVVVIAADADADLLYPRIAADGTFAYVRVPRAQPAPLARDGGVFIGHAASPAPPPASPPPPRILLAPSADGARVPLGFSDDASLLALRRAHAGSDVEVVAVATGDVRRLASGSFAEWRPGTHELLIGGRGGDPRSGLVLHDVARGTSRDLEPPRTEHAFGARWDPRGARFLFQQARAPGPASETDLVIRDLVRGTRDVVDPPRFSSGFWFARDGTILAIGGGDDSVGSVFRLAPRQSVATFCLRSRAPPCL